MSAGTPKGGTAAASSDHQDHPEHGGHRASTAVAQFARHRTLLFTVAYEITASVADAEDVVQETYLRWAQAAEQPGGIRQPRAYLVQIATRQALNRLRSRARQREDYVGPWLPEPLLTAPDVADDVVLAESVSMAMMLVVENLSPDERAVFLLREVFGFGHDEIAAAVGKSPAAVRQIAHRARSHVQSRRPGLPGGHTDTVQVVERFMAATSTGDLQGLMDVLAPDVVLLSDGGGKVNAARRPVITADKVARMLVGLGAKATGTWRLQPAMVNGRFGALVFVDGVLQTVGSLEVQDGLVSTVYLVRNPDKLGGVAATWPLQR